MIHTSKQLKDKVRNVSKSDARIAQALIRNFIMERFLERVSISKYKERFILKGGMLVASIVGVSMRATMDIDATVSALPLNVFDTKRIIEEICMIQLDDEITFQIMKISEIMSDFDYPGIRIMIEAKMDRLRQQFKLDISTDDVITPTAIKYEYQLMFENRTIEVLSYNIETLLAEKIQTICSRGIANTRMRDFYDIYIIIEDANLEVQFDVLSDAFWATCKKRNTLFNKQDVCAEVLKIEKDSVMEQQWERFKEANYFVMDISWDNVLLVIKRVVEGLF